MKLHSGVQIRQYNDSQILEFLNVHRVEYRLVGDHLFTIQVGGRELTAGPGDRLSVAADGQVQIQRGDYARRAREAIHRARQARIEGQLRESETDRWKRRVEAEARDRLWRNIRHVGRRGWA